MFSRIRALWFFGVQLKTKLYGYDSMNDRALIESLLASYKEGAITYTNYNFELNKFDEMTMCAFTTK